MLIVCSLILLMQADMRGIGLAEGGEQTGHHLIKFTTFDLSLLVCQCNVTIIPSIQILYVCSLFLGTMILTMILTSLNPCLYCYRGSGHR